MSLGALAVGQYSERSKNYCCGTQVNWQWGLWVSLFHQYFGGDIPGLHLRFSPTVGTFALTLTKVGHGRGPFLCPSPSYLGRRSPA